MGRAHSRGGYGIHEGGGFVRESGNGSPLLESGGKALAGLWDKSPQKLVIQIILHCVTQKCHFFVSQKGASV